MANQVPSAQVPLPTTGTANPQPPRPVGVRNPPRVTPSQASLAMPKVKLPSGWVGPWRVAPKRLNKKKWTVRKVKAAGGKTVFAAKPAATNRRKVKLPSSGPAWRVKPKLTAAQIEAKFGAGSKLVRAGTGAWVVVDANGKRITGKPAAGGGGQAAPATPAGPDDALLAKYADQPWAQTLIRNLRQSQAEHEGFVTGKVMPWQQTALQGLANLNQQAAESYKQSMGVIAGGLTAAGGAPVGAYDGTPGSVTGGLDAYAQLASAEAMATGAASMRQMSAWQALMASTNVNTFSQGQIAALSDYAKGLPALYATKRQELIDSIDKYIVEQEREQAKLELEQAKLAEQIRSNRVNESIRATNAQSNFLIAAGRLGVDAQAEARQGQGPVQPPAEAPPGMVLVPTDDGGWRYVNATADTGSSSGSESDGTSGGSNGVKGLVGGWKKKPSAKQIANLRRRGMIIGSIFKQNGRWYFKASKERAPRSGRNSGSSTSGSSQSVLTPAGQNALVTSAGSKENRNRLYGDGIKRDSKGNVITGSDGKPVLDWNKVGRAMWEWIKLRRSSFDNKNKTVNVDLVRNVLVSMSSGMEAPGSRMSEGAKIAWRLFLDSTVRSDNGVETRWGTLK